MNKVLLNTQKYHCSIRSTDKVKFKVEPAYAATGQLQRIIVMLPWLMIKFYIWRK